MGYEIKVINSRENRKIVPLLTDVLGITQRRAKRLIDKARVKQNGVVVDKKGAIVQGVIEVLMFVPTIDERLEPIFDHDDFAIFNKPSGMLSHPNGFNSPTSLLDHAKNIFGENANITHRLDALTSGLIIVAKHKQAEVEFKKMFEQRAVSKEYTALVRGILKDSLTVNAPLKQEPFGEVRKKMRVHHDGKDCTTIFTPIKTFENSTIVTVVPLTGRLHQIRAHAEHLNMAILGDPLYGVGSEIAKSYLEKEISAIDLAKHTLCERLCLHASGIEFEYLGEKLKVCSPINFEKYGV